VICLVVCSLWPVRLRDQCRADAQMAYIEHLHLGYSTNTPNKKRVILDFLVISCDDIWHPYGASPSDASLLLPKGISVLRSLIIGAIQVLVTSSHHRRFPMHVTPSSAKRPRNIARFWYHPYINNKFCLLPLINLSITQ
jgi:hypothetical protein